MYKSMIGSLLLTVLAIGGIIFLLRTNNVEDLSRDASTNVSFVDGKQVARIHAKGGYAPRSTTLKAQTPTLLMIDTSGTFDCSSALSIPALGVRINLPSSGVTPIDIPSQALGAVIKGVCAMGMYGFVLNFH